jgi:sulfite exporter TauE/SafE
LAVEHHNPRIATAPIAAAGLIAGYAVAVGTGSRPLGGVVLASFGLGCLATWLRRDGRRTAVLLTIAGLLAFAFSHVLAHVVGAWPAVLIMAAAIAALYWQVSDARALAGAGATRSAGRPARS